MLLVPYALAVAQEISTVDLVSGNYGKYATTLKLADLREGYKAVRLAVANPGALTELAPLIVLSGVHDSRVMAQYRLAGCYWSNGDVVKSLGREYLVAYKVDWDIETLLANSRNVQGSVPSAAPAVEPMLKINLIALNSIQKVEPCPDITKKDLIDAFGGGAKPSADSLQEQTLSNVKQVALGMLMYSNDYDDYLPYAQSSKSAWYVEYPYVKSINMFKTLNPNGGMIRFNMGIAGAYMESIIEPANTVMLYESEPWPDGRRAVAFLDGRAKLVTREEWAELAKRLTPPGIKRAKKPLPAGYDAEFDKVQARSSAQSAQPPPR